MKKLAIILGCVCVVAFFMGCQTTPTGWENVSSITVTQLSSILKDVILYKDMDDPENLRKCVIESGVSGCVNFWKSRESGKEINERLLLAVKAADNYAKNNYNEICEKYGGLDGIIIKVALNYLGDSEGKWIEVKVNESEILISLLHVFVDSGELGNLLDIQNLNLK